MEEQSGSYLPASSASCWSGREMMIAGSSHHHQQGGGRTRSQTETVRQSVNYSISCRQSRQAVYVYQQSGQARSGRDQRLARGGQRSNRG